MASQAMQPVSDTAQAVPQIWQHRPPLLALNPEIADKLLDQIAAGRSLVDVCKDEGMPTTAAVRAWLGDPRYANFLAAYVHARGEQADSIFDDMLEIADNSTNDWVTRYNSKTKEHERVVDAEHIQRARLRVYTRKWIVSKLMPSKYGDLVRTELTGKDGGAIEITDTSPQLQTLAASLRQAKRTAPVILEGETVAPRARTKAPQDAPVLRVEHKPEDISDLI